MNRGCIDTFVKLGIALNAKSIAPIVAGAVAMGSPFLGLIGQRPLPQDPSRNKNIPEMTFEELARNARVGDIILTSKAPGTFGKALQLARGSEYHHSQPIIGRQKGKGVTFHVGDFTNIIFVL